MVSPNDEEHWAWADYKDIEAQHKFTGLDAFADAEGNINTLHAAIEMECHLYRKRRRIDLSGIYDLLR